MSELLEAAAELASAAGTVALRHYRRGIEVERKADGSPVTVADREAERVARDWLSARFPRDAVLGEELGASAGSSGRTWVIDPIDGTRSFVAGVPLWGTLVAVMEGETVLAGAAAYPAANEVLAAAPGEGCWHDGRRCRVSEVDRIEDATVLITDHRSFSSPERRARWEGLAGSCKVARTWGDCFGYLLVATGRAEVMIDPVLNPWDAACFVPIIAEAGGQLTDFGGRAWPLPNGIGTNGKLAGAARAALALGV